MEEAMRPRSLGAFIRQARLARQLSGAQLARRAGVHPSNISRIESGETASPTPGLLQRLARALDVDQADLLAYLGLTVPRATPPLRTYLRTTYPALPDEALREAEDAVVQIAERYEVDRY
ncbi:helix-turn-helix transcriptional regulator [Pseudofrankia sp. DC12]|uniref:helix-turn-helix domain-containing protein n=1 Tax=Pseudofrankia sp. DC12 TaxID=683315 RepID=UPI000AE1A164|nr:helix-turn-helix transcriptional regulator [Pseudofrankia sp. DC12]